MTDNQTQVWRRRRKKKMREKDEFQKQKEFAPCMDCFDIDHSCQQDTQREKNNNNGFVYISVWPVKNHQMSIKVAQKWFH